MDYICKSKKFRFTLHHVNIANVIIKFRIR
nr:MAG TPA: hypothetical protein [Caudoviricetes sp.]DAU10432.1 MAG TPA: hypothetical protein [Caudoviricetes sp.]